MIRLLGLRWRSLAANNIFSGFHKILIFAVPKREQAEIAQLVERNLAKVKVAGSTPVFRSEVPSAEGIFSKSSLKSLFRWVQLPSRVQWYNIDHWKVNNAWVVELVDTQDLKSCGFTAVRVQFPSRVRITGRPKTPVKSSLSDPRGFFVPLNLLGVLIQICSQVCNIGVQYFQVENSLFINKNLV